MNNLELERAVEGLASVCRECRVQHTQIGQKHRDLNNAARKASRFSDPPTNLRNAVKTAKAALQEQRRDAVLHLETDHRESFSPDR